MGYTNIILHHVHKKQAAYLIIELSALNLISEGCLKFLKLNPDKDSPLISHLSGVRRMQREF